MILGLNRYSKAWFLMTYVYAFSYVAILTLLHSKQPKLHRVLAVLSVEGLK